MRVSIVSSLLLFISLFSLFETPAFAANDCYIVFLGSYPNSLDNTAFSYDQTVKYHQEILGSCLGSIKKAKSSILYSYNRYFNGFAAMLNAEDAVKLKNHPKVTSIFLSLGRKLQTTNSWEFLGLEKGNDIPLNSAWKKARFGEDVIIGNIDSGVWPESKSFSDEGMGPVPARWRGTCQTNKRDGVKCNRKLIGVRYFNRNYLKYARRHARRHNTSYVASFEMNTARDHNGHGSMTLAIAGGNFVSNVSIFGQGTGTAKGGSPKARVAAYKVSWDTTIDGNPMFDADILAAIEAAISDGVDVLSISIAGGPGEYCFDPIAVGSFHAVKNGIVVVAGAGNDGPTPGTVANVAPWMLDVGASSTNRQFVSYVTLGNNKVIKGLSLSEKGLEPRKFYPLITGLDAWNPDYKKDEPEVSRALAAVCMPEALDLKKVNGKILLCVRSTKVTLLVGQFAVQAGAVGLILGNNKNLRHEMSTDPHILPASQIDYDDVVSVFAYFNSTKNPVAHISDVKTEFNASSSPRMASFSSRGPSSVEEATIKPDVTAPGEYIISAYSDAVPATTLAGDNRHVSYNAAFGTSLSCPHVSGIAGLVKSYHPDWSPAAIKSAIMTTASATDRSSNPMLDYNNLEATPFAYGSGHVNPNGALDPGLVYDLNAENYLDYLCARGYNESVLRPFTASEKPYSCPKSFKIEDLNYPSILVSKLTGPIKYTRYLKNVGSPGTYNVSIKAPPEVSISFEPSSLKFEKYGEEKKFEVNFSPKGNVSSKNYTFGEFTWSDGYHYVRSPIAVKL